MKVRIAIDGPSGAGKSSIAKSLAKKLSIEYVDTGALYRTVAYIAREKELEEKVDSLLEEVRSRQIRVIDGKVFLDGQDLGDKIRSEEISQLSSKLSKEPAIRQALLSIQQDLADKYSLVMEGRDIGSVVMPEAEFKFFLTASPEIRSERRLKQLLEKGQEVDYETVYKDIMERDFRDQNRPVAPLIQVEDAIKIDSGSLSEEEVLKKMVQIISESKGNV